MEQWIIGTYAIISVVIGMVFGSFANVLVARLPRDASLWTPSHCPRCGHPVRWVDLVPVFSWLWLRGRCRDCGSAIAPSYPLVELLGGLLGYLLYERFFSSIADFSAGNIVAYTLFGAFTLALVVAFLVDLRHQIIPEVTSTWLIPVGVGGTVALAWLGFDAFPAVSWAQSVLGALVGGAGLAAIALLYRAIRGEIGLGFGDAKLLAMIGAFLGALPGVWVVMIFASLLGVLVHLIVLLIRKRSGYVPFGPSLALVAVIYLLYGDTIVPLLLPSIAEITGLSVP